MRFSPSVDLSMATDQEAAEFLLQYIATAIPNSSTRKSLQPEGYPANGDIEVAIRANQNREPIQNALKSLETGCGNCQEMAYAGASILRQAGYSRHISIGQFGINHQFLFCGDLIVDPWAGKYFNKNVWKDNICAYGGRIQDGIMYGRLLSSNHFELEDEEPEIIEEFLYSMQKESFVENLINEQNEKANPTESSSYRR